MMGNGTAKKKIATKAAAAARIATACDAAGYDLEQLRAGMLLYDAFYRWCRDATEETHNWPTPHVDGPRARERTP